MGVELVEIINPNGRRGHVAAGSRAALAYEAAQPVDPGNGEPSGSASREEWATYATDVLGVRPEDLLDDDGKELGRDAIRDRYTAPAEDPES